MAWFVLHARKYLKVWLVYQLVRLLIAVYYGTYCQLVLSVPFFYANIQLQIVEGWLHILKRDYNNGMTFWQGDTHCSFFVVPQTRISRIIAIYCISLFCVLWLCKQGMKCLETYDFLAMKRTRYSQFEQVLGSQLCHTLFSQPLHTDCKELILFSTKKLYTIFFNYNTFEYTDISIPIASFRKLF